MTVFFCFQCGVDFEIDARTYQKTKAGCKCDKEFLDTLRHLAIRPEGDGSLDLSLYFPPNYALISARSEDLYIASDSEEKFYSLTDDDVTVA